MVGLRHGGDELDEQRQGKPRQKTDCQGELASIVGQIALLERRLLSDPVH
jgi:hypothetical protein